MYKVWHALEHEVAVKLNIREKKNLPKSLHLGDTASSLCWLSWPHLLVLESLPDMKFTISSTLCGAMLQRMFSYLLIIKNDTFYNDNDFKTF